MPIFRYTIKKILVSPSTWVIFTLTLAILALSWALPIALVVSWTSDVNWNKETILLAFLPTWKLLTFITFVGLMLLIFIGVKATQIFRDEIDDGTLLILVSKPISRNRIWLEKWLSFQAIVISFIFLSIFLGGLLLVFPGIGGPVFFLTFLPYMAILFGISLLFDLIFTSIVLLLSLVLNSKATIAITIGFAALINIFSQAIDSLVHVPATYFQMAHSVAVFHDLEKKATNNDIEWFKQQVTNANYVTEIQNILEKVYQTNISDVNYPMQYNPVREQEILNKIKSGAITDPYSPAEIALIIHIVNISNVFRQWKEQSYMELMTNQRVGQKGSENFVDYSVNDVIKGFNLKLNQADVDNFKTKITQKRVMRYFNIFYQLFYLWNGAWGDNSSLYTAEFNYQALDDPVLVSFNKNSDNTYQVNPNSGNNKILEFPILVTFYVLVGLILLGSSWYVFNRRDFA